MVQQSARRLSDPCEDDDRRRTDVTLDCADGAVQLHPNSPVWSRGPLHFANRLDPQSSVPPCDSQTPASSVCSSARQRSCSVAPAPRAPPADRRLRLAAAAIPGSIAATAPPAVKAAPTSHQCRNAPVPQPMSAPRDAPTYRRRHRPRDRRAASPSGAVSSARLTAGAAIVLRSGATNTASLV